MKIIDVNKLSQDYKVRLLTDNDIDAIYLLCQGNPLYYKYCPPTITKESVTEDLHALPSGKSIDDKYFIGFFDQNKLICIMDLITRYPDNETAFIGLFMVDITYQKQNIGYTIYQQVKSYLFEHFSFISLAYVQGNPQAQHFWEKCGFKPTGRIVKHELYDIVVMIDCKK